jgi:hypothetical protein
MEEGGCLIVDIIAFTLFRPIFLMKLLYETTKVGAARS